MRAVLPYDPAAGPGPPRIGELPDPVPGPGELLIEVRAAGVNHAEPMQLAGRYPPPPGESEVPGLECAGVVAAVGESVEGWRPGERAMALLAGGGHAERVAVSAGQAMPIPEGLSFVEAAAVPEAGLTAWTNLVAEGALRAGEAVLVTGASGGVGSFAVQLAAALGATVLAAGRDRERLAPLADLGAVHLVVLDDALPEAVRRATGGRGADLALDLVGGEHLPRTLAALAPRGRLVLVGLLAGSRAELDLARVLRGHLRLIGSTLRPRSRAEKARLVAAFAAFALPRLADGRLRPLVDEVVPFAEAATAYRRMSEGGGIGKVVLTMEAGYLSTQ
jgi:putative PIG3 family NAD(P)H quinone oxidoreductase